jgi:hypothetical protein
MQTNLRDWLNSIINKMPSTNDPFYLQSPQVVNKYAKDMFNDVGFKGHAYELQPISENWKSVLSDDLRLGDVAIVLPANNMQFGNCFVVTSVDKDILTGVCAIPYRSWRKFGFWKHRRSEIIGGWRYAK